MYVYYQRSGALLHNDVKLADCYSGFGDSKNKPEDQGKAGLGPIPIGSYLIGAESEDWKHGPLALHLIPQTGTQTFGRSGFLVHGDSKAAPGAASHGCIIAPHEIRVQMADGADKLLVVMP